jgi:diguanylate cyclase (GGDEF)-like protein/PAS domain S-box-containing protein
VSLAAALIYWVIVALWLAVLATVIIAFVRDPRAFGATRLLLAVLAIDTSRNIVENLYFGLYFGGQYGLFSGAIVGVLGNPNLLVIPKLINVGAACVVLGLLLLRWLPMASKERAGVEQNLRQAEWRFRLLVDGVKEYAVYLLDPRGHITSWNSGAERIKGYTADDVIGTNVARFYTEEDRVAGAPKQALQIAQREGRFDTEGWRVRKDGTRFWAHVVIDAIRDDAGVLLGFAKVTHDITERMLAAERLRHLAHYDQLTGLPNRTTLHRDLDDLINPAVGAGRGTVSIAMLDLDGFKAINDTLGHSTGDRLLEAVASRLTTMTERTAQVYRPGGDEFVLIFPNCGDPRVVTQSVDAVLKGLGESFEINSHRLFIGASAGIATAPNDGSNVEELISDADLALHDAKAAGGRVWRLFLPVLRAKAQARRELDMELRRAFANNEFVLYFQPQLRMSDSAVVGAEALLRWRHPERGVIGPAAFIDALAESPLALDVGRWILQAACERAAAWRAMGFPLVRVGVNLFPAQFHAATLLSDVETALRQSGLPPDALELEITENIALGHDDDMIASLRTLRQRGVHLAFDDFGTGYASLSYLARYPLTRIKIDQSFVRKVDGASTAEDTAILRALIVMAHSLGLKVIAEGVETSVQASFLESERCEEVQGFLYAKPLPIDDFEAFLRARSGPAQGDEIPARLAG